MSDSKHTAPLTHKMETVGKVFCAAATSDSFAAR
jgi:hypothetical protein